MKGLHCSEEEAISIYESDCEIDHNLKQDFDLSPDKIKIAQKFAHTGTRVVKKKEKTVLKPRKREENVTKSGIITEISDFMREKSQFAVENLEITNKERQFRFQIGEEIYEVTLIKKNKPKK